jgi:hypothetical protein
LSAAKKQKTSPYQGDTESPQTPHEIVPLRSLCAFVSVSAQHAPRHKRIDALDIGGAVAMVERTGGEG